MESQLTLLGVVPGDSGGAVKEVALRMTVAARDDARFREQLELLAERHLRESAGGPAGRSASGGCRFVTLSLVVGS
jgi:hypothetical protein